MTNQEVQAKIKRSKVLLLTAELGDLLKKVDEQRKGAAGCWEEDD